MQPTAADTRHGVTPDEEVATRTGFEPVISAVTGQRVNRYTNGPLNPPRDENPRSNPEDSSGDVENRSLLIANSTGSDPVFESPEIQKRFWSKVDKSGNCWLWTAAKDHDGYGTYMVGHKAFRSHRFSFLLTHGYDSPAHVLHTCDVRACVNPAHLYEGTHAQNMRDAADRGRHAGEHNGRYKHGKYVGRWATTTRGRQRASS